MTSSSTRANIFFTGTVDEAIASSVQQRSAVVCFVTDGGEEGSVWESEYLLDAEVFELLKSGVVLLRLEAGSQEAGLLAAYCPVQETPHLLVIRDGAILARLTTGVSRQEFTSSIKNALSRPSPTSPLPTLAPVPQTTPIAPQPQRPETVPPVPVRAAEPAVTSPISPSPNIGTSRTLTPAADSVEYSRTNVRPLNQSYLEQQRQKKQAEHAERERILQRLENDKAERRARDRERRDSYTPTPSEGLRSSEPPITVAEVALSFRLTDGSNIKSRFPSSAVLGSDVRAWIEQNRQDGDHPFNFMEILGPSRNRPLSISDEKLPLSSLFKRSATLVLVPTQTFTSAAYENATTAGTGILSQAYGMVSNVLNAVWSYTAFTPRTEERPPPARQSEEEDPKKPQASGSGHIRTLRDQGEDKDDRKYYNGNQLSFEPKPDGN
ncbi:hypothetical protein K440DRAFT_205968 [Wilcoxina mikolae CBS 423.85]|nr:hypothetical protein K440DRAFT_205968 [Wilcoxina mikolae CBS 423.85]